MHIIINMAKRHKNVYNIIFFITEVCESLTGSASQLNRSVAVAFKLSVFRQFCIATLDGVKASSHMYTKCVCIMCTLMQCIVVTLLEAIYYKYN